MKTIGIRVTPSNVYYSIIDDSVEEFVILCTSKLVVPKALDIPERLSFIRNCLFSIIHEYKINYAGIRLAEQVADVDKERIYIEGVIQELISNSIIEKYFIGNKRKLATLLDDDIQSITKYIDGVQAFAEIEEWDDYCKEEKESIITAVAASCI